ncbi:hypothetical protein VTL71DRAFT_13126 [Oculimacula yallundae]|uniref:DNA endonuclease activator Ctp1 C-terminal domain-containing protein n=1 Tax=Oculimacula yallundae TaxID=86028 RepID=A0ABR4CPI6_9HELO
MESWKQGRGELFDQLKTVYNKIGENIAAELDNDESTRINTEELRILRETSASVQSIVESHGRLTDELELCRDAVAKVEELQKENKRLAQELQKKLSRESTPIPKPTSRVQKDNHVDILPRSSEPPSSVSRIELGETQEVTQKKYEELVKKYNKTCQKLEAMTGAKDLAESKSKKDRLTSQNWAAWGKEMGKKVELKDGRIGKLKEQITSLKLQSGIQDDKSDVSFTSDAQPETVKIVKNVLPEITETRVQVPASSPPKAARLRVLADIPGNAGPGHLFAGIGHDIQNEIEIELPVLLDEDNHIGDTSFEVLEAHHTSSTEEDPDIVLPEPLPGKIEKGTEPDQEEPSSPAVFISSKSVKKRKSRGQNVDETPHPKIKVEVIELSSPHTPGVGNYVNVAESMDLDDIGEKVSTPRKVHHAAVVAQHVSRLMDNSQHSSRSRSQSQAPSNPPATLNVTPIRSETSVLQPRSVNAKILPRTSADTGRASKKRKIASSRAVSDVTEDGEAAPVDRGSKQQTSDDNDILIGLLSKPSPNKLVISPPPSRSIVRPSTSILSALQKSTTKKSVASTSALAHELLGITPRREPDHRKPDLGTTRPSRELTPISRPSSANAGREPAESTASKRTTPSLLEASRPTFGQVPRSSAESFKPSSGISSTSSKEPSIPDEGVSGSSETPLSGTQLPARRDLASAFQSRTTHEVAKSSPRTPTVDRPAKPVASKRKQIRTEADYEMDPSQEPLRARPVSKLSLNDFKINPTYNKGYDFAFNEVVRGKDARASLEGCIKPNCCGPEMRALAKMELDMRPQTLSQEERDESLLEDYLGAEAGRIKNMSIDEREEILIRAKTREVANKSGKHRHAYERETSPSGFWRADFPTTQEELEDREKERQKDREMVENRYRHAMRPGGAYIFRDE